jgi:hypothetical protein
MVLYGIGGCVNSKNVILMFTETKIEIDEQDQKAIIAWFKRYKPEMIN